MQNFITHKKNANEKNNNNNPNDICCHCFIFSKSDSSTKG